MFEMSLIEWRDHNIGVLSMQQPLIAAIPLLEEDKEKTAFSVPRGKFEFNVTPYGLCNAGSTYQRMIDICLSGLPNERI